eukprot:gnl/TRDRNA2_/TRDRNA2_142929_c0_seq3.p1 gnl/TRDRNA2_/TRDRNA2_142929_c0~~gnl/TRDRNA2_/TRDRNA2_142929_c0_seq3.p1  ORF type:complete len:316 (-),score=43.99 gnl/TRDRNA2_/TRDRNA2_142929_c0_seq3:399-1346(-)
MSFTADVCKTFNQYDIDVIKRSGGNAIRLGVTWAGAQPADTPKLDSNFIQRLYAILDLCERNGIYVILDAHQDAYGTSACGQGAPMWFSKLGIPNEVGKPIRLGSQLWQVLLFTSIRIRSYADGMCRSQDQAGWGSFAGADDYNIKNPCCLLNNQNNDDLIFSEHAQEGWSYLFNGGRKYYVRFLKLLAEAVKDKPAAVAIELFNEPLLIKLKEIFVDQSMWHTWRECYDAIQSVSPGMLVGVITIGQQPINYWITSSVFLPDGFTEWLRDTKYAFYAWHWYFGPPDKQNAVKNAQAYERGWNMPSLLTEYQDKE